MKAQGQLWQRVVVDQNIDAWVVHDPAARALVTERLREGCLKFWATVGRRSSLFQLCALIFFKPQTPLFTRLEAQKKKKQNEVHTWRQVGGLAEAVYVRDS